MHLTFDWNAALRRSRPRAASAPEGHWCNRHAWKRFPYGNRIYRYAGSALESNWSRLHGGDGEPYPSAARLAELLAANPALAFHVPNPAAVPPLLEEAWRAYHAGDFADAVSHGLAASPLGLAVASQAAAVYASHLEEDAGRRMAILLDAVAASAALRQLAPNWAAACFAHGLALGRYSQQLSVLKALTLGLGGKTRDCLQRALELAPGHADSHVGLGIYHAEVVAKVGGAVAAFTYGARREAVVEHFEAARTLKPQSPVVLAEYARALQLAFGAGGRERSEALLSEAAACQPADALERLDVEWALGERE